MANCDGEIIMKEQYGSTPMERIYVKPADQKTIVLLEHKKQNTVIGWLHEVFLPAGYPDSVSSDYIGYQIWDTAQGFCSTVTGTLSTATILRGQGVGDARASAQAAAMTWVLRDSCSDLARILFAYTHGSAFDAYSKQWRLYADILNNVALIIELSLPSYGLALCASSVVRALVWLAGSATRAALTQHHATRGNFAEVASAESAQETAVTLTATLLALPLLDRGPVTWLLVGILMCLHIYCNTRAVRAICLKTFNPPRLTLLLRRYLTSSKALAPTPRQINDEEPLPLKWAQHTEATECGFTIHMGVSLQKALDTFKSSTFPSETLREVSDVYSRRKYILVLNKKRKKILVLLKKEAHETDVIRAYVHAFILAVVASKISGIKLALIEDHKSAFCELCKRIAAAQWCQTDGGPSIKLLRFLDESIETEWKLLHSSIIRADWEVGKHILMVDEWRLKEESLSEQKNENNEISPTLLSLNNAAPFDATLQLFKEINK